MLCLTILAEMPSFLPVFISNNRKSGVNRHAPAVLSISKETSEMCLVRVRILTRKCAVSVPWLNE